MSGVSAEAVGALFLRLKRDAEASGYHLNPDAEFTKGIVRGLLVNTERYGYQSCPCRLASGVKAKDLDIICPCDYRDADVGEFGACYCALYVSGEVARGERQAQPIPERRPSEEERLKAHGAASVIASTALRFPVWRCSVCGYLCARDSPPEVCPVCKAKKDRFERFI